MLAVRITFLLFTILPTLLRADGTYPALAQAQQDLAQLAKNAAEQKAKADAATDKAKGKPAESPEAKAAAEEQYKAELMRQQLEKSLSGVNSAKPQVQKAGTGSPAEATSPNRSGSVENGAPAETAKSATAPENKIPANWTEGKNGPEFRSADGSTYSTPDTQTAKAYNDAYNAWRASPTEANAAKVVDQVKNLSQVGPDGKSLPWQSGGKMADGTYSHLFGADQKSPGQVWNSGDGATAPTTTAYNPTTHGAFSNLGEGFSQYSTAEGLQRTGSTLSSLRNTPGTQVFTDPTSGALSSLNENGQALSFDNLDGFYTYQRQVTASPARGIAPADQVFSELTIPRTALGRNISGQVPHSSTPRLSSP